MKALLGIGCDIVEISRMENIKDNLKQRLFTPAEIAYCEKTVKSAERFAGRYAAKEAILKCFGTGLAEGLTFLDIEILPDNLGAPQAQLQGEALKRFERMQAQQILLSISHDGGIAMAIANIS